MSRLGTCCSSVHGYAVHPSGRSFTAWNEILYECTHDGFGWRTGDATTAVVGRAPGVASIMDVVGNALGSGAMTVLTGGLGAEPTNTGISASNALLNSSRVITPSWFWSSESNRLLLPPACRLGGFCWPWTRECCWDVARDICRWPP